MLDSKILIDAGIDYNAGLKRLMDNADFYEAVLTTFLSETMLERAQVAYKDRDYEKLKKIIHEAKGSGGNAGLNALYKEAGILLGLLRSGSYSEQELGEKFTDFSEEYALTKDAIRLALHNK